MDTYKRLAAWRHCHALTLTIYRVTAGFPPEERFGITDQLRRAAVSACANLAEGWARKGRRESARFAGMALSSLAELDALLLISRDLNYLTEAAYAEIQTGYVEASKTTWGLLRSMRG